MKSERRNPRSRVMWYLISQGDDITQHAHCVVQGLKRRRDPHVDAFPLHPLCGVIEGKECRCQVLLVHPSEQGGSLYL
jgi:hypothetical protein